MLNEEAIRVAFNNYLYCDKNFKKPERLKISEIKFHQTTTRKHQFIIGLIARIPNANSIYFTKLHSIH